MIRKILFFALLALSLMIGGVAVQQPMQAASVSSTFAAAGVSSTLFVPHAQSFRLAITNTWVGTVLVEESNNGAISYQEIGRYTANASLDFPAKPYDRVIRLNCLTYTSGTVTYVFSNVTYPGGRFRHPIIDVGSVAYGSLGTSTTPVAGTWYYGDLYLPINFTATGAGCLNAATVGTDKYIFAVMDGSGLFLGNTTTAGTTTAGANVFQEIAFGAPIQLTPGQYFIAAQLNGTTDRFRTVATATWVSLLAGSTAGTFATIPTALTAPTTFTADKAPICYLY